MIIPRPTFFTFIEFYFVQCATSHVELLRRPSHGVGLSVCVPAHLVAGKEEQARSGQVDYRILAREVHGARLSASAKGHDSSP